MRKTSYTCDATHKFMKRNEIFGLKLTMDGKRVTKVDVVADPDTADLHFSQSFVVELFREISRLHAEQTRGAQNANPANQPPA